MAQRVAFYWPGHGLSMAGHLARAGLAVTVFNARLRERSVGWAETWRQAAPSPAAAAENADIVLACVGRGQAISTRARGRRPFARLKSGRCSRSHDRIRANRPGTGGTGTPRVSVLSCAGVRRRAGREERVSSHYVRRERSGFRQDRAGDPRLCRGHSRDGRRLARGS